MSVVEDVLESGVSVTWMEGPIGLMIDGMDFES